MPPLNATVDLHKVRSQRQPSVSDGEEIRTFVGSEDVSGKDTRRSAADVRTTALPGGESSAAVQRHPSVSAPTSGAVHPFLENVRALDPDDYAHAKKRLKKAVLEHYR